MNWTSVDSSMPPAGLYVLAYTPDVGGQFLIARYFSGQPKESEWQATYKGCNKRFGTRRNHVGRGITHWMHLASPDGTPNV